MTTCLHRSHIPSSIFAFGFVCTLPFFTRLLCISSFYFVHLFLCLPWSSYTESLFSAITLFCVLPNNFYWRICQPEHNVMSESNSFFCHRTRTPTRRLKQLLPGCRQHNFINPSLLKIHNQPSGLGLSGGVPRTTMCHMHINKVIKMLGKTEQKFY